MKKIFLQIGAVVLLSSCGTIFSGTTQDISIDSNVRGVMIYADGAYICRTPCVYPLERSSGSVSIIGKKTGYEDVAIALKSKLNPVAFGNLFSIYSWTTDGVTGGIWRYKQDGVYLNMERKYMTRDETKKFKTDSEIRRFVLFNYPELQIEAASGKTGEYINALSTLTNESDKNLIEKINQSQNEVKFAHQMAE